MIMLSPGQTLQVNALFACDLPTKWYHEQVLEAIIPLSTSGIPCTCNGASAMVYLNELLALSCHWKDYGILRITVKNG